MSHAADQYLTTVGKCTVVQGLPEEVVAMLFGKFSRNPKDFRDTLVAMIDDGDLVAQGFEGFRLDDRTRKFHERITIGYGHKSVADHATVHFCLEGASAVAERDFTSARLLAASSKSTRFVDFRGAGFVTPPEWPEESRSAYTTHCTSLLMAYEQLVPMAVDAVRELVPYDDDAKTVWKREKGWESATHKRGLDMVRDLLPMSIKTNFGITTSATGLREMLDKRETGADWQSEEVTGLAQMVRRAAIRALPVLLPEVPRRVPRHLKVTPGWSQQRVNLPLKVEQVSMPSWVAIERLTGMKATDLMTRWINERGYHMVPDRTAEMAEYCFRLVMPIAIHRDLGRHRMMTQLVSVLTPASGYGMDPLMARRDMYIQHPKLAMVAKCHTDALQRADERLTGWIGKVPAAALQYACPLATMVEVSWKVNLRELVHLLGLRTTPQGHPSYRELTQMVAKAMKASDPMVRGLVDEVTNYADVLIGRPG